MTGRFNLATFNSGDAIRARGLGLDLDRLDGAGLDSEAPVSRQAETHLAEIRQKMTALVASSEEHAASLRRLELLFLAAVLLLAWIATHR